MADTRQRGWSSASAPPKRLVAMDATHFHDRAGITLVVADDHPPILDCLTRYLAAAGFDVLATAPDGARALEAVTSLGPVVCIADVRMPKLDGLELAREIAKVAPQTAVLLYSCLLYTSPSPRDG